MYYHVIPARSVIPGASASLSLTLPLRRADGSPFAARKGPTRRGGSRLLPTHPSLSLNTPFKAQSGRRRKYPLIIRGAISVQNSSRFVQPPPSCYLCGCLFVHGRRYGRLCSCGWILRMSVAGRLAPASRLSLSHFTRHNRWYDASSHRITRASP